LIAVTEIPIRILTYNPWLHSSIDQVLDYNHSIIGFMLESNIEEGNQQIPEDLSELKYGVSLTDACMNWETTEALLIEAAERLRAR